MEPYEGKGANVSRLKYTCLKKNVVKLKLISLNKPNFLSARTLPRLSYTID
jgi:hypothetical protein